MGQKVIGLDLDGVILNQASNKIEAARKLGIRLDLKETPSDILWEALPKDKALEKKFRWLVYDDPETSRATPLMPDVCQGLDVFKKLEWSYVLVSRRPEFSVPSALELLRLRGLWGKYFDQSNTHFVSSKKEKAEVLLKLGAEVYLDDQPSVLREISPTIQKFLFDNIGVYPASSEYWVVSNWLEFVAALRA